MSQTEVLPAIVKVDSHNNLTEIFAKWLYDESRKGDVVSKNRIAREISRLRDGVAITEAHVTMWIAKARIYSEKHLGCTLWNVRNEGWRVSTEHETAVYYCKSVKKTIAWADRTLNLQAIVKRKEIPSAIKEVFKTAEGGLKTLSGTKTKYYELWKKIMTQEQKLIE